MAELVAGSFYGAAQWALLNELILLSKRSIRNSGDCKSLAATLESINPLFTSVVNSSDLGNVTGEVWLKDMHILLVQAKGIVEDSFKYSRFSFLKRRSLSWKIKNIHRCIERKLSEGNTVVLNIVQGIDQKLASLSVASSTVSPHPSLHVAKESAEAIHYYLHVAKESAEAIHYYFHVAEGSAGVVYYKIFRKLLKFNDEECTYLRDKLHEVIQSASSFLKESAKKEVGTTSKGGNTDFVKIFKLLMVLGKQIESFVEGCCEDKWVQAAMVLTNMSEYVSSLGFNLDMCKVAFEKGHAAFECHTLDEVDGMKKFEAEVVKVKASVDAQDLIEKVTLALNSLDGEDGDLASYLLQRLLEIKLNPRSGFGTYLNDLFAWVKFGEQVGRGASATVYKAKWLGTRVAMKTFEGSENVEFEKEVEILSRLRHPNITSIFCFAKDSRSCSIVMELMDGDLNQLINGLMRHSDSPPFPFPILEAVDIILQIGEGVKYLHDQGIVHRDLKSGNILYKALEVKDAGIQCAHVKVADFAISKARFTNTTYTDLTCNTGTNRWMPPEVIRLLDGNQRGSPSNRVRLPKYPFKLDTYSFGLVCYEILSGRLPFWEFGNPIEVKKRILNKERPILPCNPSECPLMLKDLIEKCWSHEPKERPTFDVICRELTYIKYSLMTGGSMNHHVDDSRTQKKVADNNS